MKAKLILKKHNDCYSLNDYREPSKGYPLVIAHSGDENFRYKLSKQNCDEIFGIVDVEKFADESWGDKISSPYHAYIEGFNKAMELNKDKMFTLEDMRQAYNDGMNNIDGDGCSIDNPDEDFLDTINTIQQPTEIEVEIEMVKTPDAMFQFHDVPYSTPKLDSEGCLILKKI